MLRSLVSGLSGVKSHQTALDVIGNNIANINTTAFKAGRASFSDSFSLMMKGGTPPTDEKGGMNPFQIGRGSIIDSIDTIFSQGGLDTTGNPTDLTISGSGFFVLRFGNTNLYTRDGSFAVDANGTLIDPNTGGAVQGRMANSAGEIPSSTRITDITLPIGSLFPARATTRASMTGNLDSTAEIGNIPYRGDAANASFGGNLNAAITTDMPDDLKSYSKDFIIYDYLGNPKVLTITFTKTQDSDSTQSPPLLDQWTWAITSKEPDQNVAGSGVIEFNADGSFKSSTVTTPFTCGGWGSEGKQIIVNLDFSGMTQNNGPFAPMLTSPNPDEIYQTSMLVYDSLGNTHDIIINFERLRPDPTANPPVPDNAWRWTVGISGDDEVFIPDADGNPQYSQIIVFNNDGTIKTGATATLVVEGPGGSKDGTTGEPVKLKNGAESMRIALDLSELVQFAGSFTPVPASRDGYAAGSLENITIDETGTLIGTFTNGTSQKLAQIILADFHNPAGLIKVGGNLYSVSMNSGAPVLGTAGAGIRASIISNALESSNVDLANEFTKMIIAQRGFEANARVITTSDAILGELINLKR